MSAIDFPASPSDGDVYTQNGKTWHYSSAQTSWLGQGSDIGSRNFQLEFLIGDGFTGITTGIKASGAVICPRNGTVTGWEVLSCDAATPTTGAIAFDLYKDVYANYPPDASDSMVGGGTKPNITATGNKGTGSSLGGWTTTTFTAGDIVYPVVSSVTSLIVAKLVITYTT